MTRTHPFVRVVVLAFDNAGLTLECLQSLVDSQWPTDRMQVVLVDNGSLDDVVAQVRARFPTVAILEPLENLGFAAGCNLGITSTTCSLGRELVPFECVAFVNNDAAVAPNWLDELVPVLMSRSDLGAVSPKMLFAARYSEIEVSKLFMDDPKAPHQAVRVRAVRIDAQRNDALAAFDESFTRVAPREGQADEIPLATSTGGRLRIVDPSQHGGRERTVSLLIDADAPGWVMIRSDVDAKQAHVGDAEGRHGRGARWVECRLGADVFDVINNAGSELYTGGSSGDRGFLERDRGQYDDPCDVFAWCGGAVVLRKEYLDDVGLFDESFFLYYEDTDLAWRGRIAGWNFAYVPTAVVRHHHAQSSGAGSDLFNFHVERNRLLALAGNAPIGVAVAAALGVLRRCLTLHVTDIVLPALRLSLPRRRDAYFLRRVLISYLTRLAPVIRKRWVTPVRVRRRRVMAWTVDKVVPVPHFEAPDPAGPDTSVPYTFATSNERERTGRPRAGIYNLFWSTMGGGEAVGAGVARALAATHDVTLLGPEPIRAEEFRSRVGIDLSQCSWLQVSNDDEASRVSESFDVFVNCTFMSRAENRARIGLYYVNFPGRVVPRSRERAIRAAMALARLASRLPTKSTKARTVERLLAQRIEDTSWTPSYTHVVANSEYARTWVRRLWRRDSTVIHPPVTTTLVPDDKQCLIASVGRFFDAARGHSKKQWELLETFHDMAASSQGTNDWRLALVGGADAESREYVLRIRRFAKDLPVDVIVNAPRSRVDDVLAHASIYWHASGWGENESEHPERFEHFGISVVEAMASGAVPVVFAVGGPADIVRDGVDGFHWRTREELIAATRRLMQDPALLARMSASAQVRSRDYGLDVFDRRVRETIDGVLHSG